MEPPNVGLSIEFNIHWQSDSIYGCHFRKFWCSRNSMYDLKMNYSWRIRSWYIPTLYTTMECCQTWKGSWESGELLVPDGSSVYHFGQIKRVICLSSAGISIPPTEKLRGHKSLREIPTSTPPACNVPSESTSLFIACLPRRIIRMHRSMTYSSVVIGSAQRVQLELWIYRTRCCRTKHPWCIHPDHHQSTALHLHRESVFH